MADSELTTPEHWRTVVGNSRYEVSDRGRVRSLRWTYTRSEWQSGRPQIVTAGGKMLKPWIRRRKGGSIVSVNVGLSTPCGYRHDSVHRLVLATFVGPCPDGMEGCHNDGDPTNNTVGNLRWDTHKANSLDSVRHGTKVDPPKARGDSHPKVKLTDSQVRAIRSVPLSYRGLDGDLARAFAVTRSCIAAIRMGRTRRWAVANVAAVTHA